jgi:ureidoacrylate peracid hydrolase
MDDQEILRTLEDQVQPGHTALVIVDVQNDFVHPDGLVGRITAEGERSSFYPESGNLWEAYPGLPTALERLEGLMDAARDTGAFIVFLRATYDRKYVGASYRVKMEEKGLWDKLCQEGTFGADFYGNIRPRPGAPGEVEVVKHQLSGFWGTDLDQILRRNGVKTVLMTGVATCACVESTARDAFFNDYYVVMVDDCCADWSDERHAWSLQFAEWLYGKVTTAERVKNLWGIE